MKYTIYLALAGMACACNPILTLQTTTPHPPNNDNTNYALLPSRDSTAITAEAIGTVSYRQTGWSIPWTYDQIARWIQGTAMQNGANLVKITDFRPGYRRSLVRVDATLYNVKDLKPYEREISWTSDRKLTYADFKGPHNPRRESGSRCQFYSRTLFLCTESWIDREAPDTAALLEHEQGNFDLAEIYRRQFETAVQGLWESSKKKPVIFQEVYSAYLAKKRQYELETNHGQDKNGQARWTIQIQDALSGTGGVPDPHFAVEKIYTLPQKDSAAKALVPAGNKALVYIIRSRNVSTSPFMQVVYNPFHLLFIYSIGMNINAYTTTIADTTIGPIEGHSYAYQLVDPGAVELDAGMNIADLYHGIFFARPKKSTQLSADLLPGNTYYFKLVTNATWLGFAAPQLQPLTEAEGKRLLRKCRLSRAYAESQHGLYVPENGLY